MTVEKGPVIDPYHKLPKEAQKIVDALKSDQQVTGYADIMLVGSNTPAGQEEKITATALITLPSDDKGYVTTIHLNLSGSFEKPLEGDIVSLVVTTVSPYVPNSPAPREPIIIPLSGIKGNFTKSPQAGNTRLERSPGEFILIPQQSASHA